MSKMLCSVFQRDRKESLRGRGFASEKCDLEEYEEDGFVVIDTEKSSSERRTTLETSKKSFSMSFEGETKRINEQKQRSLSDTKLRHEPRPLKSHRQVRQQQHQHHQQGLEPVRTLAITVNDVPFSLSPLMTESLGRWECNETVWPVDVKSSLFSYDFSREKQVIEFMGYD
eukprot:m.308819 g.308819  ORF g.308819 m.308819 type:complete len:171 (+) comp44913_c0_seq1:58-570(+)